jgi:hypothetical protein
MSVTKSSSKMKVTFWVDRALWQKFGKIADDRGHSRTWYLLGCVRETVEGQRREVKRKAKKKISSSV